jgi:hypothetical protein
MRRGIQAAAPGQERAPGPAATPADPIPPEWAELIARLDRLERGRPIQRGERA